MVDPDRRVRSLVSDVVNVGGRPLTICAIGNGESTFVAARLRWFADRGHRVFLLTTSPSPSGIAGVVEVDLNAEPLVSAKARLRGLVRPTQSRRPRRVEQRQLDEEANLQRAAEPRTSPGQFLGPLRTGLHSFLTAIDVLRALRRCKPEVVHVHYAYSYYAWLTGLFGCRPLVITVEGGDVLFEEQGTPTPAGKWSTVRLLRQADYITTQSNYLASAVNRLGDFHSKTERILWGVSLDEFRPRDASALRRDLGLRPEDRIILSPKILQPFYRVHLVVEAMAIVRRHCPDALLVVGEYAPDAAYREQLANLVADLDLGEHVRFAGVIPHEDMPVYYSLAELSIAVPPSDGLPQALLESLACGTPQILSRLPRYEEIVQHEESTYFVDASREGIASGIVRLLEDAQLRNTIAKRGRLVVERQADIDEQAARVENRFRELAATTPRRTVSLKALCSAAFDATRAYMNSRLSS